MSVTPGLHHVDVDGGALAVEVLGGTTEPVLAIHGISSQRKLWNWLRVQAPELTIVAPDLRGRAGSYDVKGESSVQQHAADAVAVLDAMALESAHIVGMSMGGFVAIELATAFPNRVKSLVLIDGGFPMRRAEGLTREMIPVLFADRLGRLSHRWDSVEEYADFFVSNTGPLLDRQDPLLLDYLAHDLVDGQVSLSADALIADAASLFFGDSHWESLDVPLRFSYAQWSSGIDTPGAYPHDAAKEYSTKTVSTRYVAGVDHAGSIMSTGGARVAAELIREALA